ncbi:hypothetical protein [Paractinoplanes maris]|uniref:hypothetical protein n=1 Tax=Paractinoplanes maris TaxID=1734446 RepID=UPI002020F90D|nr:hypothetical protein [Actinoplanes maris]
MTVQDENGVYRSLARERRNQRRKQLGVGLAGVAVFAGAGSFVMQSRLIDLSRHTETREPLAVAPRPVPAPSSSSPSPSPSVSSGLAAGPGRVTRDGARQRVSPAPPPSSTAATSVASPSIAAATSASSPSMAVAASLNRHEETTRSSRIRVTSAGFDLTGKPELSIVGDPGWEVGAARCTKTVRSATGEQVRVMPSVLVCWRTSPRRSVVTVATAKRGRPSSGESVAVIDREWARLR